MSQTTSWRSWRSNRSLTAMEKMNDRKGKEDPRAPVLRGGKEVAGSGGGRRYVGDLRG